MAVLDELTGVRHEVLEAVRTSGRELTPEEVERALRDKVVSASISDIRDALLWLIKRDYLLLTPARTVRLSE